MLSFPILEVERIQGCQRKTLRTFELAIYSRAATEQSSFSAQKRYLGFRLQVTVNEFTFVFLDIAWRNVGFPSYCMIEQWKIILFLEFGNWEMLLI
jgi:hypothetical protein